MKEGYMVTFFAAQDSRRRERPCVHGHIMVSFFAAFFRVFRGMTMIIWHVIHLTCARARVRVQHDEKSWSFYGKSRILGHETRPCHDHDDMVTHFKNENRTIKKETMWVFSFFNELIRGGA